MTEYVMTISPDGKEVAGLYSDKLPYRELGNMSVTRASTIEFNGELQKWVVNILDENRFLGVFESRQEAIDAEIRYLNDRTTLR